MICLCAPAFLPRAFCGDSGGAKPAKSAPEKSAPAVPKWHQFESKPDNFKPRSEIDKLVLKKLRAKNIEPSSPASEAVLMRRVWLDLAGCIPSESEAREYLADKSPDKYRRLVEKLLASDEFNHYTVMRLGDFLRIKSEFPINLWPNAAQAYSRFLYESVAAGKSWAEISREMLVSSGSSFRVGAVNFYRASQEKNARSYAAGAASAFMGLRFDSLGAAQKEGLEKNFCSVKMKSTGEWKEEIVCDEPLKKYTFSAEMPDGSVLEIKNSPSPRADFARWLTSKNNRLFARAFANRAWSWLFGRGIAIPADDIFGENSNEELLEHLAKYFAASGFNIRALFRHIALSRTYAGSCIPRGAAAESAKYFASYPVRQSEAEVVIDMLCKITGSGEVYESATPEPYTLLPQNSSAVALYDAGITTSFLELFGKSPRDTGRADERKSAPSASQRLHLLNSSHVRRKIESSAALREIVQSKDFIRRAYLAVLSRYPTKAERDFYAAFQVSYGGWQKKYDFLWALFNSEEFINRH